jgi:signal transduction histidine kinase
MEHLAAELLDLEKIEAGVERAWAPLNLVQLAQEAVDELRAETHAKQQHLELSAAEVVPDINGNALRLKQAVSNLISNAVKYTPAGGNIWVRVRHDDQAAIVEVQDTGYGIPLAAQARLFQRFFRAKAPGTEKVPGTGLGLSLVKAIVEQHGGQVSFVSEPGQGSTFTLRLPLTLQQIPTTSDHA